MSKSTLERSISDSHYRTEAEYERSSKKFMRSMVPSGQPLRILDIGCGTGLNAANLTRLGHKIIGVDLSSVAVDQFRRRGFEGFIADIEAGPLPFPNNEFDLVYASEVIEHCADTAAFLKELRRLLKPDGVLLLSTPNSAFWPLRLLAVIGRTASEMQHPGHIRFFSKRGLSAAIEDAGFDMTVMSARHMYVVLGRRLGDPLAPLMERLGLVKEARFATGDHFWQLSRFAKSASTFWADTLIASARKTERSDAG